jgi:hypothetical protein
VVSGGFSSVGVLLLGGVLPISAESVVHSLCHEFILQSGILLMACG